MKTMTENPLSPGVGWIHTQNRAARLDPSRKERDIFPLPCPPKARQEHGLSRRSQQRFDRKRHILADIQGAVKGLNSMNGFSPDTEFDFAPDPMQNEVLERMVHLSRVAAHKGTLPALQPEAALRELLRGRSEYESPNLPISLARFNLERISLPDSLDNVPNVVDILPEEARQYLKSPEQMVRGLQEGVEPITPYWDPTLKSNTGCYRALLRRLRKIGYLRFTRVPLCQAGLFFVYKSDKKRIRLIVEARPANQIFASPPGVHLCTSEGFARIQMEIPEDVKPGSPGNTKTVCFFDNGNTTPQTRIP